MATQWYQNHLGGGVKVLLITNDKENKKKANEDGIHAETGSFFLASELYVKYLSKLLYFSCVYEECQTNIFVE